MTTTKEVALEKLWNTFMERYCPQPQGQNCCGNGYSSLYIAMPMGKKSPWWAWDITWKPSFQGHWVPSQDLLHLRKHKNASKNARKAKVKFYLTALILLSALLVLPFQWCWHFFLIFFFSITTLSRIFQLEGCASVTVMPGLVRLIRQQMYVYL